MQNPFNVGSTIAYPVSGGPTWPEFVEGLIAEQMAKSAEAEAPAEAPVEPQAAAPETPVKAAETETPAEAPAEETSEQQPEAEKVASSDVEVKVAEAPATEETPELDASVTIAEAEDTVKTAVADPNGYIKIASLERPERLKLFAALSSNASNLIWNDKNNNPLSYVEGMTNEKFANFTPEEKEWFKSFWRTVHPEDFVEKMTADR